MPTPPAPVPTLTFVDGLRRQTDYWLTVYRRTWRATVISSFVAPIFYVVAMGVLLGGFIDADPSRLEGAPSYLAFVAPGLVAAHAMQTAIGEVTYPVMGALKWHKTYFSQHATPLQADHIAGAHLAFVAVRLATTCGVFMLALTPFGLFATWWGPIAAFGSQILVGMAFAAPIYALSVRLRSENAFGLIYRLGVVPLFLFSGAFFPVDNLGALAWVAKLTPLWHGVSLSRMFSLGTVEPGLALLHVAVLLTLCAVGWRWSVAGLRGRLVS